MSEALMGGAMAGKESNVAEYPSVAAVLVVDDERGAGKVVVDLLARDEIGAQLAPDLESACAILRKGRPWVTVVSASSPSVLDKSAMRQIAQSSRTTRAIFINPGADVEEAAALLRAGAFRVLTGTEPSVEELVATVRSAVHHTPGAKGGERAPEVLSAENELDLSRLLYRDAKERALQAFEERYFRALLSRTGGNVSEAARQAGLDRSNFRRALRRAKVRASSSSSPKSTEESGASGDRDGGSVEPASPEPRPLARAQGGSTQWLEDRPRATDLVSPLLEKRWASSR
jgi:DNA-binding NtrC family response regulator